MVEVHMRLAKIKNKYLYKSDNPEGTHTYAVYYDQPSKRYRAIGLTHLYVKDDKRFMQVKKGNIRIEKFKEFDVPSGVYNFYYDKTSSGNKIDLSDRNNVRKVESRYLSKAQSDRLKKFAKNEYGFHKHKKKSHR